MNLGVVAWFLLSFRDGSISFYVYRSDFDVYRLGAQRWLNGGDLYGILPNLRIGTNMPFTYPPIAAALFTPFAIVPFGVASAALAVLTIASVALVLIVVLRSLSARSPWLLVGMLLPVALVLEPVRTTLYYGQINALLMALVVLDCLVRKPRWPRGVLVGLAAAIKLTPAVFVLFFLLRGDRRAALTAGASFVCATALGFLLGWRDSWQFWTTTVFDSGRIGGATRAANQSITGLLARLGFEPGVRGVLWLLLAAALMGVAAVGMRRAVAAGQHTLALGLNALGALPIAPVSWSHHWVWAVVILLTLGVLAWRTRTWPASTLAAGGVALFVLSPHWWWARDDHSWTGLRMLLGNTYLYFAVLVVTLGVFVGALGYRARHGGEHRGGPVPPHPTKLGHRSRQGDHR